MTDNTVFSLAGKRVFVAGHRGMVGSAVVRRLHSESCEILTVARDKVDLRDQSATRAFMEKERPDAVVLAAARVGGILANATYPADFLFDNLAIECNVINAALRSEVEKLLFLGSSCIYPKISPQPIPESALLSGPLEETNEWYALAKIAGIKLCDAYRRQYGVDFISAMPCNLYGPGDNFDLQNSHVIPALIRKAHEAKVTGASSMEVWGTGTPRREFLYVDDLADGLVFLLKAYSQEGHINVGYGEDLTIAELATIICDVVNYTGNILFNRSKPDGSPSKLLDVSAIDKIGWSPKIDLRRGLQNTYQHFLSKGGTVKT